MKFSHFSLSFFLCSKHTTDDFSITLSVQIMTGRAPLSAVLRTFYFKKSPSHFEEALGLVRSGKTNLPVSFEKAESQKIAV